MVDLIDWYFTPPMHNAAKFFRAQPFLNTVKTAPSITVSEIGVTRARKILPSLQSVGLTAIRPSCRFLSYFPNVGNSSLPCRTNNA